MRFAYIRKTALYCWQQVSAADDNLCWIASPWPKSKDINNFLRCFSLLWFWPLFQKQHRSVCFCLSLQPHELLHWCNFTRSCYQFFGSCVSNHREPQTCLTLLNVKPVRVLSLFLLEWCRNTGGIIQIHSNNNVLLLGKPCQWSIPRMKVSSAKLLHLQHFILFALPPPFITLFHFLFFPLTHNCLLLI